jgi:hypothetical protein
MRNASQIFGSLGVLIGVVGCQDKREVSIDPFGGDGVGSLAFTMECVYKAENGECMNPNARRALTRIVRIT